MVLGSAFDILSYAWAPRVSFVNYPLGHQAGKPFDAIDQKHIVYTALQGFYQFKKPGQVNILDVEWPEDVANNVLKVGNAKDAIRPTRVAKRVYQSAEDMLLAVSRYGKDAHGIVSPEAIRQQKFYTQAKL
jgi:hypothetical protein